MATELKPLDAVTATPNGAGTPMRICPRGCEYREVGRRTIIATTTRWGRAAVREVFEFEATNCALCGALLKDKCDRCDKAILVGAESRCRFCGVPYPWARDRALVRSVIRKWQKTAIRIYGTAGNGGLFLFEGDITKIVLDQGAIVSTDDVDGAMWSDVAHAIKLAAGIEVERQSVDNGAYKEGEAWYTDAGALDIDGIVHVAAMRSSGQTSLGNVRKCVQSALALAGEKKLKTLALPAIGSGTSGLPVRDCVAAITEECVCYLSTQAPLVADLIVVLFERPDFREIAEAAQGIAASVRSST